MSGFVYIVTEGVHDVAFLGKLLAVVHGAKRIRTRDGLEETHREWLGSFKWPSPTGKSHDISRLSVPAPVFYRLPKGEVVAVRNAQGITKIGKTLEIDLETFARIPSAPAAIGVVLDSDDEPEDVRFTKMSTTLAGLKVSAPPSLGQVTEGTPRVGVFALPEPGRAGTLEDLLLTLGDAAYPALTASARDYADGWHATSQSEAVVVDWKELRTPAGSKKATVAAMTAVLKPGKSTQVSLEDNRWVSEHTTSLACLQPCLAFLSALLGQGRPVASSRATHGVQSGAKP